MRRQAVLVLVVCYLMMVMTCGIQGRQVMNNQEEQEEREEEKEEDPSIQGKRIS